MEKISYTASYTRISLYAQVSSTSSNAARKSQDANKPASDGAAPVSVNDKGGHCQRSKDGDSFTLSIEAQTIQISGTYISDDAADESHALDLAGLGSAEGTDAAEGLSGGFLKALLNAMEKQAGKQGHRGQHRHFPQLGDSQDVADKLLQHLRQQHAERGGSKSDFADEVKRRLDAWKPAAQRMTVDYQEFRSEVRMKLTTGLDAWTSGAQVADPSADPDSEASPDSGILPGTAIEI